MGSAKSGRWRRHNKKGLVNDALQLDVSDFFYGTVLKTTSGRVPLRDYAGQSVDVIEWQLVSLKDGRTGIGLSIQSGIGITDVIPFAGPTTPMSGQPAFTCPSDDCGASCRKLYLPAAAKGFFCRRCHNLTYRSQQKHDPRISRLARDPDRLIQLCEETDFGNLPFGKRILLMRACSAALRLILDDLLKNENQRNG